MGRSSKNRKRKNWFPFLPKKVEYVYLFLSPEELYKYKVGLSNAPELRMKQVGKKVVWKGFIPLPCFNALRVETAIHNVLKPLNTPVNDKGGSGGTEWFLCLNILTFAAIWLWFGSITTEAIIAILCPYPIDGVIVVLLAWILDTGLILSAIGVVVYLLILIYGN